MEKDKNKKAQIKVIEKLVHQDLLIWKLTDSMLSTQKLIESGLVKSKLDN